jgi:Tfp pilus assembly protein PilX
MVTTTTTSIGRRGGQRGDILIVVLILLLLMLLGAVTAMRSGIVDSWMAGNNMVRQKDVHVSDIAFRILEQTMNTTANGKPLAVTAQSQAWYRDVTAVTAAPTAAYWDSCLGNASATLRCGAVTVTVNGTTLPYTVLAVVQPTFRSDASACNLGPQFVAIFYDVFIHVQETGGATAATTETVYQLCAEAN